MSRDNLEIASQAVAAFNSTDVEAFTALATADFEWFPSMIAIEGESFIGADGIRRYFDRLADSWEHFQIIAGRFLADAACVVVLARLEGRGKASGATVDSSLGMVFDFRGERISRIRGYLDHDQALRAAGFEDSPR